MWRPPRSTLFPYTTLFRSEPDKLIKSPSEAINVFDFEPVARQNVPPAHFRSEEHTSELQSLTNLVCRLLLEKKKQNESADPQQAPRSTTSAVGRTAQLFHA